MPKKKPWRTIIIAGDTGRFTREQIQAAVAAVKAQREQRPARKTRRPEVGTCRPSVEDASGRSAEPGGSPGVPA